jgi:hypothetical protein
MSKHADISGKIMQKVANFERKRSIRYLFALTTLVLTGIAVIATGLYLLASQLFEAETGSLLSLYFEDRELIGLLWQDAMTFVWDVVSHEIVYLIGIMAVAIIILAISTRHKRQVVLRRLREIARGKL